MRTALRRHVGPGDPRSPAGRGLPLPGPLRDQATLLRACRRDPLLRLRDQGAARGPRSRRRARRGGDAPLPAGRRRGLLRANLLPGDPPAAPRPQRQRLDRSAARPPAAALLVVPAAGRGSRARCGGRAAARAARGRGPAARPQRRSRGDLPEWRARLLHDRLPGGGAPSRRADPPVHPQRLRLPPPRRELLRATTHGGGRATDRSPNVLRRYRHGPLRREAARDRPPAGRALRLDQHRGAVVRLRGGAARGDEGDAGRAGRRRDPRRLPRLFPGDRLEPAAPPQAGELRPLPPASTRRCSGTARCRSAAPSGARCPSGSAAG